MNGIAIREKSTKKLVEFIECSGRSALQVLGGSRINLNHDEYQSNEEFGVTEEEVKKMKEENRAS